MSSVCACSEVKSIYLTGFHAKRTSLQSTDLDQPLLSHIQQVCIMSTNSLLKCALLRKTGVNNVSHFEMDYKYTPFWFSRVRSYTKNTDSILC